MPSGASEAHAGTRACVSACVRVWSTEAAFTTAAAVLLLLLLRYYACVRLPSSRDFMVAIYILHSTAAAFEKGKLAAQAEHLAADQNQSDADQSEADHPNSARHTLGRRPRGHRSERP